MDDKINIAMIANNLETNGISSVIMNYCTHLNLNRFNITIFVGRDVSKIYKEKCEMFGIKVIELPHRKQETLKYYWMLNKNLRRSRYDIAHIHGSNASIAIELFIAQINGIKIKIAHSHNTTCTNIKAHKLMLPIFNHLYTQGFACGEEAGRWLFGNKDFYVVKNGFDVGKFQFKQDIRDRVRKELNVEDKYVIGHIGRFNYQKNHKFLLDVFECIAKRRADAVLLLIGTGPDFEEVKNIINQHPFKHNIILYGETANPETMYMAMDAFAFPSRFEGLPVTLLEAQISGLFCVISDVITKEVILGNRVKTLSIYEKPEKWADELAINKSQDRRQFYDVVKTQIEKYNIENCALELEKKYLSLLSDNK